jgi:hypothetical protein
VGCCSATATRSRVGHYSHVESGGCFAAFAAVLSVFAVCVFARSCTKGRLCARACAVRLVQCEDRRARRRWRDTGAHCCAELRWSQRHDRQDDGQRATTTIHRSEAAARRHSVESGRHLSTYSCARRVRRAYGLARVNFRSLAMKPSSKR